jgi:hypothetical protein
MRQRNYWIIIALTLVLIIFTACSTQAKITRTITVTQTIPGTTRIITITPVALTEDAVSAIYAAAIRQIFTQDDSYGGKLQPPILHIKDYTDDKAGNLMAASNSESIPKAVQSAVLTALYDLPTELSWIVREDDRTPFITLGNIYQQQDGTWQIAASIYIANLAAKGQTYVLRYDLGAWKITGNTGRFWIA